ncbi:FAD binding domain protein [Biscogniauxia mediterranea]|nr:FAD binding domain protein [Biscogniauxia mediterranea]
MFHTWLQVLTVIIAAAHGERCKNIPDDANWPSSPEWDALNETVGGRLISTVPLASVCHSEGTFARYNKTECAALQSEWDWPQVHFETPAAIMPAWFQESCNPFSPMSQPCELGDYASYSINVTDVKDVLAGIEFAKAHEVRLVVKNTGHEYVTDPHLQTLNLDAADFSGKSTGKGGMSLWMHNVKGTEIIPKYERNYYTGPAIKVGAGTLGLEAYEAANSVGYRLIGGNCPSVGIAGGYTQGGGHSSLSSQYGLAADNVLEWEVVTASGEHLIATPESNEDLYWALCGGGAGAYAVVLSMTARLHQDGLIGGGYITFNNATAGNEAFWKAVGLFNQKLPAMTEEGGNTIAYSLTNNAFGIYNLAAPGKSATEVHSLLGPFLEDLDTLGIPYNCSTHESATFLDQLRLDYGPFPNGPFQTSALIGSRLIPRSVLLDAAENDALTQVLRDTASGSEFVMLMQSLRVGGSESLAVSPVADNAVLPAWRTTALHAIVTAPWDWNVSRAEMQRRENVLSRDIIPALQAVTPGSGTYLNEANFAQKDWQKQFYGSNYPRLLAIKKKYDPYSLFYATAAVGSEEWGKDAQGRLCRTDNSEEM